MDEWIAPLLLPTYATAIARRETKRVNFYKAIVIINFLHLR